MRHLLSICLLAIPVILPAQIQPKSPAADTVTEHWHVKDKKEATAKEVLFKITVYNLERRKMAGVEVRAVQTETGKVWQGVTGTFGEVIFLLPKGKEYRIDAGDETGIQTLTVSNEKFARESLGITYLPSRFTEEERNDTIFQNVSPAQTPTRSRLLVHLTMLDLDDRPLEDEEMFFEAKLAKKVYRAKTNRRGKAYLVLPLGDTFCISTRFEPNLKCYYMPKDDRAGQLNITYNTIGTKEVLRRKAERERQAAIRDSLYRVQRTRDSIAMARAATKRLRGDENFVHQLLFGQTPAEVRAGIERKAGQLRDSVARDPRYFEKTGEAVQATLYRMKSRWKNKVIVTDLTGSMTPYMDQVLLWHALQLVQGEDNRYVFFNDGDAKADHVKIIGQTGGIYFTEKSDMDQILETMKKTAKAGFGGDGPENDVEALLAGEKKLRGLDELILVADNYSDMRDISLLSQLQVPVHVILCGTDQGVNEEYLELAYKTKGSVHTIEQDIEDLARLADGATIVIGGDQYRVNRGKFIRVTRL